MIKFLCIMLLLSIMLAFTATRVVVCEEAYKSK